MQAFSALLTLWLSMMQAVGLASRSPSRGIRRRARDECDQRASQCTRRSSCGPCCGVENLSEGSALAAGAQDIHDRSSPRANLFAASAAALAGGMNGSTRATPHRQVARIALGSHPSHRRLPSNRTAFLKSQQFKIQQVLGRTLRNTSAVGEIDVCRCFQGINRRTKNIFAVGLDNRSRLKIRSKNYARDASVASRTYNSDNQEQS